MLVYFLIASTLLIMGLVVHKGKAYFLISGYNTYSKEKREKVDVVSLARLMGYYGYSNAFAFFLTGALDYFGVDVGLTPALIFFGLSTMALIIRAQKYDGNMYDEKGVMTKKSKVEMYLVVGILGATFLFVGYMMFASSRDIRVTLDDQGFEIHGMYGDRYLWTEVDELKLLEEIPEITMRTNGSAIGSALRGNFRMKEFGSVKLFMDAEASPYISFEHEGKRIIFNLGEGEKTRNLYIEMVEKR